MRPLAAADEENATTVRYVPARGCDLILSQWCNQNCTVGVSKHGHSLVARRVWWPAYGKHRWQCFPHALVASASLVEDMQAGSTTASHCGELSKPGLGMRGLPTARSHEQVMLENLLNEHRSINGKCQRLAELRAQEPVPDKGCAAVRNGTWPWPLLEMPIGRFWREIRGQAVPEPLWMQLFDWRVYSAVDQTTVHESPRSVFLSVPALQAGIGQQLVRRLARLKLLRRPVLAIGGADTPLSAVLPHVRTLVPHFRQLYYEGLDIDEPGLRPLPEGLAANYLCSAALDARIAYEAATAGTPKRHDLLAAWGMHWPQNDGIASRERAAAWASSMRQQGATWLHHRAISPLRYWSELATYRFVLDPIGACVQNVRLWEALLLGVIPIGDAASFANLRLQEEGYPIVLVRNWQDITESRLSAWSKLLADRVREIQPLLLARAMHRRLVKGNQVHDVLGPEAGLTWQQLILPRIRPKPILAAKAMVTVPARGGGGGGDYGDGGDGGGGDV